MWNHSQVNRNLKRTAMNFYKCSTFVTECTAWTPVFANSNLWLDASDKLTIVHTDTLVSTWYDKSGNGNDVIQTNNNNKPKTQIETQNGYNTLLFDGNDFLQTQTSTFPNTDQTWLIACGVFEVNNSSDAILSYGPGSNNASTDGRWELIANDSVEFYGALKKNISSNTITSSNFTVDPTIPLANVYSFSLDAGNNMSVWFNGNQSQIGLYDGVGLEANKPLKIFSNITGTQFPAGKCCEVICLNGVDEELRQAAEGYLAWKWGTFYALPLDHPFRSGPPCIDADGNFTVGRRPLRGFGRLLQYALFGYKFNDAIGTKSTNLSSDGIIIDRRIYTEVLSGTSGLVGETSAPKAWGLTGFNPTNSVHEAIQNNDTLFIAVTSLDPVKGAYISESYGPKLSRTVDGPTKIAIAYNLTNDWSSPSSYTIVGEIPLTTTLTKDYTTEFSTLLSASNILVPPQKTAYIKLVPYGSTSSSGILRFQQFTGEDYDYGLGGLMIITSYITEEYTQNTFLTGFNVQQTSLSSYDSLFAKTPKDPYTQRTLLSGINANLGSYEDPIFSRPQDPYTQKTILTGFNVQQTSLSSYDNLFVKTPEDRYTYEALLTGLSIPRDSVEVYLPKYGRTPTDYGVESNELTGFNVNFFSLTAFEKQYPKTAKDYGIQTQELTGFTASFNSLVSKDPSLVSTDVQTSVTTMSLTGSTFNFDNFVDFEPNSESDKTYATTHTSLTGKVVKNEEMFELYDDGAITFASSLTGSNTQQENIAGRASSAIKDQQTFVVEFSGLMTKDPNDPGIGVKLVYDLRIDHPHRSTSYSALTGAQAPLDGITYDSFKAVSLNERTTQSIILTGSQFKLTNSNNSVTIPVTEELTITTILTGYVGRSSIIPINVSGITYGAATLFYGVSSNGRAWVQQNTTEPVTYVWLVSSATTNGLWAQTSFTNPDLANFETYASVNPINVKIQINVPSQYVTSSNYYTVTPINITAIPNLKLDLDASRTNGLYSDALLTVPANTGDTVGGWKDFSPEGNDFSQLTSELRPTFTVTNGRKGVFFSGVDYSTEKYMSGIVSSFNTLDKLTTIMVVSPEKNAVLNEPGFLGWSHGSLVGGVQGDPGRFIQIGGQTIYLNYELFAFSFQKPGDADPVVLGSTLYSRPSYNQAQIITIEQDAVGTRMFVNSTPIELDLDSQNRLVDYTPAAVGFTQNNVVNINKYLGGGEAPTATWFEFIAINNIMSSGDRAALERYLMNKWQIT
jgi:hypothetical protein